MAWWQVVCLWASLGATARLLPCPRLTTARWSTWGAGSAHSGGSEEQRGEKATTPSVGIQPAAPSTSFQPDTKSGRWPRPGTQGAGQVGSAKRQSGALGLRRWCLVARTIHYSPPGRKRKTRYPHSPLPPLQSLEIATLPPPDIWITDVGGLAGGSAVAGAAGDAGSPLGREDPLEEGMASYSSILAWRIPWTEKPGGLQSIESQKFRHDWCDLAGTHAINSCLYVTPNSIETGPFPQAEHSSPVVECPTPT